MRKIDNVCVCVCRYIHLFKDFISGTKFNDNYEKTIFINHGKNKKSKKIKE